MDWQSVAIREYKNTSEIGHYKSLTDVSKTPIVVEDIDYLNHVCLYISLKIKCNIGSGYYSLLKDQGEKKRIVRSINSHKE
jgi:hypothetical protein